MSFRSTGIWAHLPCLHPSNWKRLLRMKRTRTKVQWRFRSKWRMVRSSSIQRIWAQCWIRFSVQSTTNFKTSVLMRQSGSSMLILFFNQQMTGFQATSIWFQACPEKVSGASGLGHLVHREEVGLGYWYARSTGGGWTGSWKDFHLGCSGNALQIGNWESCNLVATVHFMGEYPWIVGDFGAQQLSWHCQWRTSVVSAGEIEFCALPAVGDPDNNTSRASCTCISPWTNLDGYHAWSCRDH